MISVDIIHPPMDLENISDLDLKADTPCLDNEADPCPEADHSPALQTSMQINLIVRPMLRPVILPLTPVTLLLRPVIRPHRPVIRPLRPVILPLRPVIFLLRPVILPLKASWLIILLLDSALHKM